MVEFISSLLALTIEMVKTVSLSLVLPVLNIGFSMFTEDGSVSEEMATELIASFAGGQPDEEGDELEMVQVVVN